MTFSTRERSTTMRVLVLCERVGEEGGMETYLRTVLPALVAAGDDVQIAARFVDDANAFGAQAEQVAWSDEHDAPSLVAAATVGRIADRFLPDVVLAENVLDAAVLGRAFDRPAVRIYGVHDHRPFCPNGDRRYPQGGGICTAPMGAACTWHALVHGCAYGPRAATTRLVTTRRAVLRAIRRADAVLTLSPFMAAIARAHGISSNSLHVIAPPLANDAYASSPMPRPAADTVLFAGRLVPSKGCRTLLAALARLPRRQRPLLVVAGEGPELEATIAQAERDEISMRWLGRCDPSAMRAAYDAATLVAMPSLWAEPFGLVGIEAFARGRPVVAFSVGAIPDWIGGAGVAVHRGDEAALAQGMADLLAQTAWGRASQAALLQAQGYRLVTHIEALHRIFAGRVA